jgi:Rrf2 family protein
MVLPFDETFLPLPAELARGAGLALQSLCRTKTVVFEPSEIVLRLTKKADYGLMAMRHLAEHAREGSCSAKDLADAYGIPPPLLAKILQRLVKAGLLHSQHGTNGGYTLARNPSLISAFEVIRAIDGPLFITSCITVRGECDQSMRCTIREPLRRVNQSIEDVLRSISISDMKEEPESSEAVELVSIREPKGC